jgi:anaphase-promoting complex subunit 2
MTKALNKWVNLGVIKGREGGEFVLLEVQEEGVKLAVPRQGTFHPHLLYTRLASDKRIAVVEDAPSVMTVEQQQAEQMKVYWRVCFSSRFFSPLL